ncbi:hypothetical protein [Micromonospora sp. CPCC 206061]|uniref:hypothetical protein n=1 Tax=Micromonospora sp. CPCC 206061 TaxID=3122410 RepID=UPI002FF157FB
MPRQYVTALAGALLAEPGAGLVGVYLHGSAVLGGYIASRSDVDVLAVIAEPTDVRVQMRMRDRLISTARQWPTIGLEMSVITAATAANLGDCPYELHVVVDGDEVRAVLGAGQDGDLDLILYAEVCRRHGLAVYGPPAGQGKAPWCSSARSRSVSVRIIGFDTQMITEAVPDSPTLVYLAEALTPHLVATATVC